MRIFTIIFLSVFFAGETLAQVFTNYTTAEGLADNGVNCVAVDADDNIWFGTNKGISKFDGVSTWETMNVADGTGLLDDVITAIHITEFGEVWVGTDFGICRYTNGEFTCYTDENDIGNKRVQAITEGIEGDMFFGNRSGYARLDAMGDWSSFGVADGIPFGGVKDIEVGSNGTIWLALGLSGIIIKASNGDQFAFQEPAILSNSVTGIVLDGGEAWISSGAGVDNFTNLSTDIFIPHPDVFELPPPHTLNQVVDVQIDSKGRVWAGIFIDYLVNVGGITFLEDEVWTSFDVDDGLIGPVVKQLAIDSQDNVWVATSSGVSKYGAGPSRVKDLVSSSFSVSPNPALDFIQIDLESYRGKDQGQAIEIYDSAMQLVSKEAMDLGQADGRVDVSRFVAGVYFVRYGDVVGRFLKM